MAILAKMRFLSVALLFSISHVPPRLRVCFRAFVFTLLALMFSAPHSAQAASKTWNGGGADSNWNTGGNWGGSAPVANDSLFFGGSTRVTPANNITADT